MNRVLIANRGEIAVRIARAARELGIEPVGIASEVDRFAYHRQAVSASRIIGPADARRSYLHIERVIAAAQSLNADAIHPGYGFLSESAEFAEAVHAADITFVGPGTAALRSAGDKRLARKTAQRAGIATLDGYDGENQRDDTLLAQALTIGFPVLLKASNGGGGRGQRVVRSEAEFADALAAARREARGAFGDASMLIERYVEHPRHIEVQILADLHGTILTLGERDCSVQRRRQKVLEEAPAARLSEETRATLHRSARTIAQELNYTNAGTVEFLLDQHGACWFLEVNARLQVEHPVTETVTGVDIVQWQLRIARGEKLTLAEHETQPKIWAIEARVCAEDPAHDLLPTGGTITAVTLPQGPGIRVDRGVTDGSVVPLDYDSLLLKVIASGVSRAQAHERLDAALAQTKLDGITTNIPFLRRLLGDEAVREATVTTDYIDQHHDQFFPAHLDAPTASPGQSADVAPHLALACAALVATSSSWRSLGVAIPLCFVLDTVVYTYRATRVDSYWRLEAWDSLRTRISATPTVPQSFILQFQCRRQSTQSVIYSLQFRPQPNSAQLPFSPDEEYLGIVETTAQGFHLFLAGNSTPHEMRLVPPVDIDAVAAIGSAAAASGGTGRIQITAPMPGRVLRLAVTEQQQVADRTLVAVLEAMKMEHRIETTIAGRVEQIFIREGETVAAGAVLFEIGPLS